MTTHADSAIPAEEGSVSVPPAYDGPPAQRKEIHFHLSDGLAELLEKADCSVLISTYLIGNLVTLGSKQGRLFLEFHTFDRPMGMAASREGIAVATRNQIWFLPALPHIGPQLTPQGKYDVAYFARRSHYTGNISCHEVGWVGKELWIVNTRFSCLCTLHASCHFAPRWRPPFITALVAEDRCHLNGLATEDGQARYVTALGETDAREAWRPGKATGGCVIDVKSNAIVSRGMAMPHSPRVANGRLYVLHSGVGKVEVVDPANGRRETVCELPGYLRGFAIHGSLAFVGLSKTRPSSSMDNVPIAEQADKLKSGVWVIDLDSGAVLGHVHFTSGIDELFDVQVIPGVRSPYLCGPLTEYYLGKTHWTMPSQAT